MVDSKCFWSTCDRPAQHLCGVCDGWFCHDHSDHGPYGDAGHGEDPAHYRARMGRCPRCGTLPGRTHSQECSDLTAEGRPPK